MHIRTLSLFFILLTIGSTLGAVGAEVGFNQDIRPILSKKCFQCHGPDEQHRKAHLRLDRAGGEEGAYRVRDELPAVKAGDPEGSALWRRINAEDEDEVMPPPSANKEPVTEREKSLIRQWILDGAAYEKFWSFEPLAEREIPQPKNTRWSARPIDRFVMARLEKAGLEPNPRADKRTLIRRVTLDLTGLPPTIEEIRAFLDDSSDRAYVNLVDRLLAKPQYGEHMAKYWLDLVRFADTNGLHHDHYREMTPYRDWVIRAFNENLSFDQFTIDQLAGDLHDEPSRDQLIASGFNRLHLIIDRGTALPEESFTRNVVDRVSAAGTAFLGLTVQCAVCHDHKYDPIRQKDFYQLYAFFNNFDGGPETGSRGTVDFKRGLQPPYIEFPTEEQKAALKRLDIEIAEASARIETLKAGQTDSNEGRGAEELKSLEKRLETLNEERDKVRLEIPATLIMKEWEEVRPAHILIRGVYDRPGEEVERNTPAFLPPMEKTEGLKTRMDLAEWVVDPGNPLTARVAVNRFWQQFFGVGLVKTSEDFGAQGEPPSHPGLLDHLALEFVRSGWNVKSIVRSIVLSETYRQSSKASVDRYRTDPENRLLSRGSRFRLDAEIVRDQILAVSGLLNQRMYGKSVKPPQPPDLWKAVAMPSSYPRLFESDSGEKIYRRSVYSFWKRALPPPQMTLFDAPMRESCIARRERTNTPLQALLLMNEPQYFLAARHCARGLLEEPDLEEGERIRLAYEKITAQPPGDVEFKTLNDALLEFKSHYRNDADSARAMTADVLKEGASMEERVDLAAWTMLTHSILNLDIVKNHQ